MLKLFTWQLSYLFKRKEAYIVLYILMAFSIISFLSYLFDTSLNASDVSESMPAYSMFIGHTSYLSVNFLFVFILPLIAPMGFADSSFVERKNGINNLLYIRVDKSRYLWIKAFTVFLGSFIIILIPLLMNFIWCILHFPMITLRDFTSSPSIYSTFDFALSNIYLNGLYIKNPYLYVIIYSILISFFSAVCSLLVYAISLFVRNYRVTVVASVFVIINILMIIPKYESTLSKVTIENVIKGNKNLEGKDIAIYEYNFFTGYQNKGLYRNFSIVNLMITNQEYYIFLNKKNKPVSNIFGLDEYAPCGMIDQISLCPVNLELNDILVIDENDIRKKKVEFKQIEKYPYIVTRAQASEEIMEIYKIIKEYYNLD